MPIKKGYDTIGATAVAEQTSAGNDAAGIGIESPPPSIGESPGQGGEQETDSALTGELDTQTEDSQVDQQGQDQGQRSTPSEQVPPQQNEANAQLDAPFPHALKYKGQEFRGLPTKDVIKYAQLGMGQQIRGKELNDLQKQLEKETSGLQPLRDFDGWMRSDPQLAAVVEQAVLNYQAQVQHQGGQPAQQAQPQYDPRFQQAAQVQQQVQQQPTGDPRVDEIYSFFERMQEQQADEKLNGLMTNLRTKYSHAQWDLPDPKTGKSLEDRIYDFMVDRQEPDPEVAYKALNYDADLSLREQAAKVQQAKVAQQKFQQGAVIANNTAGQTQPSTPSFDQFRGQKHSEIGAQLQRMLEAGQLQL